MLEELQTILKLICAVWLNKRHLAVITVDR